MDCSLPGSSVHGILQARILGWLPFPILGNLPDPGIKPTSLVSRQVDSLPLEPPGKRLRGLSLNMEMIGQDGKRTEVCFKHKLIYFQTH